MNPYFDTQTAHLAAERNKYICPAALQVAPDKRQAASDTSTQGAGRASF